MWTRNDGVIVVSLRRFRSIRMKVPGLPALDRPPPAEEVRFCTALDCVDIGSPIDKALSIRISQVFSLQ